MRRAAEMGIRTAMVADGCRQVCLVLVDKMWAKVILAAPPVSSMKGRAWVALVGCLLLAGAVVLLAIGGHNNAECKARSSSAWCVDSNIIAPLTYGVILAIVGGGLLAGAGIAKLMAWNRRRHKACACDACATRAKPGLLVSEPPSSEH